LPWHWVYGEHIESHRWALVVGVTFSFVGDVVAGWFIGTFLTRRAFFASMIGVAVCMPIALTSIYINASNGQMLQSIAGAIPWLNVGDPDIDPQAFKIGATLGGISSVLVSSLIIIYVARLASSRKSPPLDP